MPADDVGRDALDLMRAEVASPGLGTAAMTEALMKACLVALLRGRLRGGDQGPFSTALPADPRLARAVLAVLEHPGAPHTVASLVDKARMSRASCADHFEQTLGSGAMEFVQSTRLRAAARLLEMTSLPLKAVAAAVGYADPSSLSRALRGAYGTDLTAYRSLNSRSWASPLTAAPDGVSRSEAEHQPMEAASRLSD